MELRRPFGIDETLGPATARDIFARANDKLQQDGFTALGLLAQWKVAVVCSTDDPVDSLEPHARLAARKDKATEVYPTWRPDKALLVEDLVAWTAWLEKLEAAASVSISTWDSLLEALEKRHAFFHERGCRASDHGLERIDAEPSTDAEASEMFARLRKGRALDAERGLGLPLGAAAPAGDPRPRARLGAAVPRRRAAQQQHAHAAPDRPRHRLRLGRRLRAGPPARALPRPPRRERPARQDDPLQPEPARQRAHGHDGRQLPGRPRAREDAVGLGLVVPRPARRDGGADPRARQHGRCSRASSA